MSGLLLKRLPQDVDPRGDHEKGALGRAFVADRWRHRNDQPKRVAAIPRNTLRFGKLAK